MPALRVRKTVFVGTRCLRQGSLVSSSDPVVKGREHLFEDPEQVVEQATAAPGERRSTRRKKADEPPAE